MRFGRRNKTGSMWGRRANSDDPIAENAESAPAYRTEGDPAQALLNVLGRFQRHYLRGKEGTNQSAWSDDCMNALIDAVDVAVAQRWQEVVSVLTETARILQTYEDADRANECVPFLTSSHEVLCHMVGDLLSGQIRPGLLRKWESLCERGQVEVEAAGLSLVQDEVSDQELAYEAFALDEQKDSPFDEPAADIESEMDSPEAIAQAQVASGAIETQPEEPDALLPFELPEMSEDLSEESIDIPLLDDLPDLADPGEALPTIEDSVESDQAEESPPVEEDYEERILSFPSRPMADESDLAPEIDSSDEVLESPFDDVEPEPEVAESEALTPVEPDTEPEPNEAETETLASVEPEPEEPELSADDEITGILDAACEALSNMTESLDDFELHVLELEARADASDWIGASAACRSVLRLLEMLNARNLEPTDRFLELAYGFSGVYVESRDSVGTEEYRSFQKDCVTLLQEWMDDPGAVTTAEADSVEPEPVAAEEASPIKASNEDDPALAELLDTVRAAMQGGRAANAKLLMLEAAARIAQDQEGEAAELVGEAERALSDNTRALEEARSAVQMHENGVGETAAKVTDIQQGQETHRRQAAQLAELLEESRNRVDTLDEQIRDLENRRAAAETDRVTAQEDLETAREAEHEDETNLESARTEERDARLLLEEERGKAKTLQNSRGDLERAVIAQREQLARQRQSTQDIEQTIAHTRDSESGGSSEEHDSLF